MAETEIKKILNIQTDKAVRSVKSLQKEIKDLKSQLLSLDSTSEEYSKTLAEVADKTFELRDLNEEIRYSANDLGEKIGVISKTLSSTTQIFGGLKGAMQLVGIETDNLDKAMADMISIMSIVNGLNGIDGLIKNVGRLSIQFSGSIKAVKGFIGALSGVKKSLLGTGIGAIIVILGTLISQWDKIVELFGGGGETIEETLDKINQKFEDNKNHINDNNKEAFENYIKNVREAVNSLEDLKKAEEEYNLELNKNKLRPYTEKINELDKQQRKTVKNAVENFEKIKKIANSGIKSVFLFDQDILNNIGDITEQDEESVKSFENYFKKQRGNITTSGALAGALEGASFGGLVGSSFGPIGTGVGAAIGGIGGAIGIGLASYKVNSAAVDYIENIKEINAIEDEINKTLEEREKVINDIITVEDKDFLSNYKNILSSLEDYFKTPLQKLEDDYKAQKELFERNGKDTTLLTKKFQKERYELLYGERDREIEENRKALRKRIEDLKNAQKTERQILNENYNKDVEQAKKLITNKEELNDALIQLQREYHQKIEILRQQDIDKWEEEADNIVEEMEAASEEVYNIWQGIIGSNQKQLQRKINETSLKYDKEELNRPKSKNTLKEAQEESRIQYEKQKEINQIELDGINEHIKNIQSALDNETIINEQRLALQDELNDAMAEKHQKEYDIAKQNADRIAQVYIEKEETFKQYFNGITTAFNSLGGLVVQVGQMQKEAAKDDEKRQEDAKGVMRTGIIIQTLGSAAAAAYQGWQMQPPPLGAIMAALFTAQAIATGVAQLQSLDNETLNGNTSASVTPNLNYAENLPSGYYRNLLGDKETEELNKNSRVYVVESDITSTQNRVDVVESNSTF